MTTSYKNGHKIYYDYDNCMWRYEDGMPANDEFRPCPKCNELPGVSTHDPCFDNLPGVRNACCGHGQEDGYIQFDDETLIRFNLVSVERHGSDMSIKDTRDEDCDEAFITEFNCFVWNGDEKKYFGIRIEPTKDVEEAIELAKNENDRSGDVWACGVYINGKYYGDGTYKSLEEVGIAEEYILL